LQASPGVRFAKLAPFECDPVKLKAEPAEGSSLGNVGANTHTSSCQPVGKLWRGWVSLRGRIDQPLQFQTRRLVTRVDCHVDFSTRQAPHFFPRLAQTRRQHQAMFTF
jgi:hypothetical protein